MCGLRLFGLRLGVHEFTYVYTIPETCPPKTNVYVRTPAVLVPLACRISGMRRSGGRRPAGLVEEGRWHGSVCVWLGWKGAGHGR